MTRTLVAHRWAQLSPAVAICLALAAGAAQAADTATEVCLKNGTRVRAVQVESKGSSYVLHADGGAAIEVAADSVKSFGVPCDAAPPAAAATQTATATPAAAAASAPTGHFGIYGSNTIGERLMPMLIEAYAKTKLGKAPKVVPVGEEQQQIQLFQGDAGQPLATIELQAKGSGTAYPALLDGKAVIGMSSRAAKPEEVASINQHFGVDLLAPGSAHVLGLDGLAVVVSPSNPIRALDLPAIAKIFAGQVTDWADVTGIDAEGNTIKGPNLPIAIHARDDKSGTYDTFKTLVLSQTNPPAAISPGAKRYASSESLSAAVTKDPGAIGFIGLPYINQNHALGIATSCGLISSPSRFGVKTEDYALTRRLFLYTAGSPHEPVAKDLMDFVVSDEAQKIVGEADFVDQAVELARPEEQKAWADALISDPQAPLPPGKQVPKKAVATLKSYIDQSHRSSIVFRFEKGKAELDIRAHQDIERLHNYLARNSRAAEGVYVVGFADADGTWAGNLRLANDRAVQVAGELAKLGYKVPAKNVVSMSYLAPVACNDAGSDASKAKNRRVEVWLAN